MDELRHRFVQQVVVVSRRGIVAAKPWLWPLFLGSSVIAAAAVLFAPRIGLGENYDFVLYRRWGVPRSQAIQLALWPIFVLAIYEWLGLGIKAPTDKSRIAAVAKAAWIDGSSIARRLFGDGSRAVPMSREYALVALLFGASVAVFAVLLPKSLEIFKASIDQHWWQALLDADIAWGTPVFAFGGSALYSFGIQLPLKGQLLPTEGLAHLFPLESRVAAAVSLYFLATMALFWCIGAVITLRPISRAIFAGSTAFLLSIPVGLDRVLWFLPPHFFTHQFTLALWWGEAPILCAATALLFLLVGRQSLAAANASAGAGFAIGAFAVILAYPVGAVFFVPILALYCLGFVLTCESRREFIWKVATAVLIGAVMLIARVPTFIINLYSYTFGRYFSEFSLDQPPPFRANFLFASHIEDPRGVFVFVIAFAALGIAALKATGALRRLAIAVLVCETGIILITTVNSWVWGFPLAGAYAELAHAPLWGAFFVLAIIVLGLLLDRRLADWAASTRPPIKAAIHRRRWAYAGFAVATAGVYLLSPVSPQFSDYPPGRPPSVELLVRELALAPGMPFRGRLLTLVPAELIGPSDWFALLDVADNRYRRFLGNDHYIDVLASNVPTLHEYGYWASPPKFALARIFLGKEREGFGRAWFVISRFDQRFARLLGVRFVATNAATIPGGTLVHEERAGDTALRIFRIDGSNLGQYSPTRLQQVRSASEGVAAMAAADFDPELDAIFESEVPSDLLSAASASVSVDRGPTLVVRATSAGRSLLVLPFEFSHCLRMKVRRGPAAQLVPVNLQQIGLLFETSVDIEISYRFGLFGDVRCRGEDRARADRLDFREALVRYRRASASGK